MYVFCKFLPLVSDSLLRDTVSSSTASMSRGGNWVDGGDSYKIS